MKEAEQSNSLQNRTSSRILRLFFSYPQKTCQRGIFPINGLCYNEIPQKFFE